MTQVQPKTDSIFSAIQFFDRLFKSHGFEIRMVGGAVRDYLYNTLPNQHHDIDFCTNATPTQMLGMVSEDEHGFVRIISTGIEHGTLTFVTPNGSFEITTLRKDVETDGRHAVVEFTDDWKADAARRDFTINAMMMDASGKIYDWFGGEEDLKRGIVRFVGDADARIKEDALRIVRNFRFDARFGKEFPSGDTYWAIQNNKHLLKNVSPERIWQEIKAAAKVWDRFDSFMNDMILQGIFAEYSVGGLSAFVSTKGLMNSDIVEYPTFGVALFIAEHAVEKFADTFKLSNKEREELEFFTKMKDFKIDKELSEDLIVSGDVNKSWLGVIAIHQRQLMLAAYIDKFEAPVFPISGGDLIAEGMKPSREFGDAMSWLRQQWIDSRFSYSKQDLITIFRRERDKTQ